MRISEFFRPGRPAFSIELYPPRTAEGIEGLEHKLVEIAAHDPDYISVTYGAGGGTRAATREICGYIKNTLGVEAVAHLTCAAHSRTEIDELLDELHGDGIENIMALRGDPPRGEAHFAPRPDGFAHAVELVRVVKAHGGFGIGVAGYPEGHVEAVSYEEDLRHQVDKINAGADVVVSQLFLDNALFLRWRDKLRRAGVTVPIEAGILPALTAKQITRFSRMCGASVPKGLCDGLLRFEAHPESAAAFGLHYALRQIEKLLAEGVDGVHLYALNRLEPIRAVSVLVHEHRHGL